MEWLSNTRKFLLLQIENSLWTLIMLSNTRKFLLLQITGTIRLCDS